MITGLSVVNTRDDKSRMARRMNQSSNYSMLVLRDSLFNVSVVEIL